MSLTRKTEYLCPYCQTPGETRVDLVVCLRKPWVIEECERCEKTFAFEVRIEVNPVPRRIEGVDGHAF